jgi:hypothetical protein
MRYAWLAALPVAALTLAACGGSTPAAAPTVAATKSVTAAQACKQSYDAWKTGPAKTIETGKLEPALKRVQAAGASEDLSELRSALEATGRAARDLKAYPMPVCADPRGYWPQMLALLQASGDNARSSSGLSALLLAEAPLQKVPGIEGKLTAELKRDAAKAAA